MEHLGAGGPSRVEERINGCPVGRGECDVRLPETFAGLLLPDPEGGVRGDAVADRGFELHDSPPSERSKNGVVEGCAPGEVGALYGHVIEHSESLPVNLHRRPRGRAGPTPGLRSAP